MGRARTKTLVFSLITLIAAAGVLELVASYAVLTRLRLRGEESFTKYEPTPVSLINLPYRAAVRMGLLEEAPLVTFRRESAAPLAVPDPRLGYRPAPGVHVVTYLRRTAGRDDWERLRVKATHLAAGERWAGDCPQGARRSLHVFGDSFVYGTGVNDEQTFAYLLQQALGDLCVRLHAFEGYGLTQSYLRFQDLRDSIGPEDIVLLGYADFLDERNVAAPSRLRQTAKWSELRLGRPPDDVRLPRAAVRRDGGIEISYVQQRCERNRGYCEQANPPQEEMSRVSAALINAIAAASAATVYLLYYRGEKDNPVFGLLDPGVEVISALPEDFDYVIRDDVLGFDPHPGPYWHYAIGQRVIEALR